ncbi:MAG: hypothetical protein M9944_12755 [Rhizobiaceae bacterium]|nr:hypothetical protein [Rhizobiaceae bacterium]
MPLRAFAVRQAFENGVLQQSKPFRIAVVIRDDPVLAVKFINIVRVEIRLDVMDQAPNRTSAKLVRFNLAIRALEQHIGGVVSLGLLQQFCLLFRSRHLSLHLSRTGGDGRRYWPPCLPVLHMAASGEWVCVR